MKASQRIPTATLALHNFSVNIPYILMPTCGLYLLLYTPKITNHTRPEAVPTNT
jgi:hypothetical protein